MFFYFFNYNNGSVILFFLKINIDFIYVKMYYFNFFLIIRKNFVFFFSKFNFGE